MVAYLTESYFVGSSTQQFTISPPLTLFSFSTSCPPESLAHFNGNQLVLNIGPYSSMRSQGASDGSADVSVTQIAAGEMQVSGFGQTQDFGSGVSGEPAVTSIYADADAAGQIRAFAGESGVDRVVELALGTNLRLDLEVIAPHAQIVSYAAESKDPVLPVRACMTVNVTLRFVLLYGVQRAALELAAQDITAALADGALSELPVTRFGLDDIAAAQEAVEAGVVGKVLVIPG